MAETYGCSLQDCIDWLDAKAKRHGECEDAAAAAYLRRLAEAERLLTMVDATLFGPKQLRDLISEFLRPTDSASREDARHG